MRAAARLRDQRPGWVVAWAAPLRRFTASPLFRAPRGTHLTAATPGELAALMDQVEQAARRPPPATTPQPAESHSTETSHDTRL